MNEKVLVTGGAGFIGVPTVERLLSAGHEVVVVDNFSVGSRDRLAHLTDHPRLEVAEVDLRDAHATGRIVCEIGPTCVVHLAAHHFIPYCKAHPADTIAVNVSGTQNLLDALVPVTPKRILFASTADVYKPAPVAHFEGDQTDPDNIYGMSKLMGEKLMRFHADRCPQTDTVVMRFFNAIGPFETNPHLVPDILDYVRAGDELPLGNTDTRRDYIHTDDMADAIAGLASGPSGSFLVNVGTGVSWDAKDIVHFIGQLLDRDLSIVTDPAKVRASDRPNLQASVRLLETLLPGFRTKSLRESLACTLEAEGFALGHSLVSY